MDADGDGASRAALKLPRRPLICDLEQIIRVWNRRAISLPPAGPGQRFAFADFTALTALTALTAFTAFLAVFFDVARLRDAAS